MQPSQPSSSFTTYQNQTGLGGSKRKGMLGLYPTSHGVVHQLSLVCWQPVVPVIQVSEQHKLKVIIFKWKWEGKMSQKVEISCFDIFRAKSGNFKCWNYFSFQIFKYSNSVLYLNVVKRLKGQILKGHIRIIVSILHWNDFPMLYKFSFIENFRFHFWS